MLKRKPNEYKSGKPRLRGLNKEQLVNLHDKQPRKKEKAKIMREIKRRFA